MIPFRFDGMAHLATASVNSMKTSLSISDFDISLLSDTARPALTIRTYWKDFMSVAINAIAARLCFEVASIMKSNLYL